MKKEFLKKYLKETGLGLKDLVRALLISSIINFVVLAIGLGILKIKYFILIALLIAFVDLLPVLGAGMVMIPWAIIEIFMGNMKLGFSLGILFALTFIIKQIIEPIILGRSIGLNPFLTILISVSFMIFLSPGLGALVGPIVSMMIGTFLEVRKAFEFEKNQDEKIEEKKS